MNQKLIFVFSIIIVAFGYVTYQSLMLDKKFSSFNTLETNTVIKQLPEVSLSVFDEEGELNLVELAGSGKTLVVHFWATWCAPCEKEFPDLLELTKIMEGNKNVEFLFVAVNDDKKKIKKFIKKFGDYSNFKILIDDDSIHQKSFGTFRLPETFIFGKDLSIIKKYVGRQEWTQKLFVDLLNNL
jgi:cytochrome c biogenesis protein CcmG/thiol:disulfide interchange protein DsbE